jgi:glycosyltransferase involved in cell wall biosynthesis
LIEALSCGKPVIATRCGGPEWIVNEKNGFLVTKGDESYLANAMQKMVKNYHVFCPELIRKDCVGRFSEQAVVARLERIYASVVKWKDR